MNRSADRDLLLADVLSESTPIGFREALLDETLRRALHRRRARQVRRAVSGLAVLALIAALWLRNFPQRVAVPDQSESGCKTVFTQPLVADAIIHSHPLGDDQLIASTQTAELVQTTTGSGKFREIGDRELLALIAPHPAALVRRGAHAEELVFVNPADQKGFPLN